MSCCFFFVKQKTAYEMRISDWSSDVCSSDLRDERDARELEMLVEGGNVGLIARHAVERLRQHNIELAGLCIGEQFLDAWTQDHTRARDGRILEAADHLPSLTCRALAAAALLVGDRRRPLPVGTMAGIEARQRGV